LFVLMILPWIAMAEPAQEFVIGTPDHPTIDGGFVEKQAPPKKTKEPNKTSPQDAPLKKWDESKVEQALKKAAKGGKLAYVLDAAKRYQLPASVALIPIIESRYEEKAISPKGAVGAWQLSQAVASDYHLPDKARTDFKASTDIALQHLKTLYAHYGQWDYVWGAYNAGQGRVDNALKKSPHVPASALSLPAETQDYIAQMSALQETLSTMGAFDA
jgi:soluble lytic murein transglycosylase-like protein